MIANMPPTTTSPSTQPRTRPAAGTTTPPWSVDTNAPGIDGIQFLPHTRAGAITKIVLIGQGMVVQRKYTLALAALLAEGLLPGGITVASLQPQSVISGVPHQYICLPENIAALPVQYLEALGLLSPSTLYIIATPPRLNVVFAASLARFPVLIALEKPVATNLADADRLAQIAAAGAQIVPIDHKVFMPSLLGFIETVRRNPDILLRVNRVEGFFFETDGIEPDREQVDGVADVQWHLLTATAAIFQAARRPFRIAPRAVTVATHRPDPAGRFAAPTVPTASRIEAQLTRPPTRIVDGHGGEVAFDMGVELDLHQGKGVGCDVKRLVLRTHAGQLVMSLDLHEPVGWRAHYRVLKGLIAPAIDMRHTLADAVAIARVVEHSRALTRDEGAYSWATLPSFLSMPLPGSVMEAVQGA